MLVTYFKMWSYHLGPERGEARVFVGKYQIIVHRNSNSK